MAEFEKFIRLTGMFKQEKNPKCSTATPNVDKLKEFVNVARAAIADDKLIQFSFWDNGTKPNQYGKVMDTLNYREVDGKSERAYVANKTGAKPAYKPKVQVIEPEEPLEEPKLSFESEAY